MFSMRPKKSSNIFTKIEAFPVKFYIFQEYSKVLRAYGNVTEQNWRKPKARATTLTASSASQVTWSNFSLEAGGHHSSGPGIWLGNDTKQPLPVMAH